MNYLVPRAGGEAPLFYRAPLAGALAGVTRLSFVPGLDRVFQRFAVGGGFGCLAVAAVSFLPIRYKSVNWTKRAPRPLVTSTEKTTPLVYQTQHISRFNLSFWLIFTVMSV